MGPSRRGGARWPLLRGRLTRAMLATVAVATGGLVWSGLAGGTQPYETYEATVAGDGPVAQFRFNDAAGSSTIADSVGSYTATNSGIVLGGAGPFGGSKSGALGGEAFATLPADPLAGATAFTAEAWVDWAGGTLYKQPIFDFGSSSTNYMYLTPASALANHKMLFEIRTSTGTVFQVTAPKLAAKAWEYVAVSETSTGTLTLYLDGEQVGQITGVTLTPASLGSTPDDYLGKPQVSGEPMFNGSMSNVAFYSKALSASQILAHYRAGEFPVNTVAPTVSGTAKDGKVLTAKAGTWSGLTPITFAYQWTHCNASGGECKEIPAATETKYTLGHENVGQTLRVVVTASNSAGGGTATSAQTAVVEAIKLSNSALPVITGSAKVGQELAVSNGSWEGSPPTRYEYQWETCSSTGTKCKSITGATAASYEPLSSQVGDTLRAVVTAANSAGSVSATSEATAVITTGPPRNKVLPAISGTAVDGEKLTASSGSWAGTEPIEYSYQWQSCNSSGEDCSNVSGASGSSYTLGPSNVGSTLDVVVTAKNSVGSTSSTSHPTPVVAAKPPANTSPASITGIARDGQTLTASTGSWSGTPPLTYSYQWERCNSAGESCANISGATSSTYVLGHSDVGMRLRVAVTAENPAGSASSTSAPTAAIAAAPPSSTEPPVISGTSQDGQTLTASTGSWTGTPPLTYTYQWESCNSSGESCASISGATASTYTTGDEQVGHTLRVNVTAENAAGEASAASAATATVAASAPANTELPAISGEAKDEQTLTASTGTWTGTPPLEYAYQWEDCDALGEGCLSLSGATSPTYVVGASDIGMTLRVVVTATNSAGSASSTSQATEVAAAGSASGLVYRAEFGSEGAGDGELDHPADVAVNAAGDLWVLDRGNTRVEEFNEAGRYLRQFGSQGSGEGQLSSPDALAVDSEGDVWVLDTGNERVEEFGADGEFVRAVGAGMLGQAEGIAFDRHGDLWVSSTSQGRLLVFNDNGEYLKAVGSKGSEAGQLGEPEGIAVDSNGDVWVADWANDRVEEFNEAGGYMGQFGSAGFGTGEMSLPYGIAVDNGHVFVGEVGNDRVQEFTEDGGFLSQIGTSGSEPGQLNLSYPIGLAVNSAEDLWVTDSGNDRVEEWGGNPCTANWIGPEEGSWETAADWSKGATPTASDVACVRRGATVRVSSPGDHAASILGEGSLAIVGGSLSVGSPASSAGASIHALTLSGGSLDITGSLSVSGLLEVNGSPTIEGSGQLVVEAGATGSIGDGECSTHPLLSEVTLSNEGTLTFGVEGGAPDGAIAMEDGARFENAGTFAEDSYDPGCGQETTGYSFYDAGGSAPSIVNTGTFQTGLGGHQSKIGVDLSNRKTFEVESGTLELTGGGSGTDGAWLTSAGATLAFPESSYALTGGSWSGEGTFALSGATVTAGGLSSGGHENLDISAGSLTLGQGPTIAVHDLSASGGRLSTDAKVLASGALSVSGEPTISGSGSVVEGPSATGTIGAGTCSTHPVLSEVTFVNEGTLSFGGDGGAPDGAIAMENGASFFNRGTFNDESFDAGCAEASNGYSFYDAGGAAPEIVNYGAFETNGGAEPIKLGVETFQEAGSLTVPEDGVLETLAPLRISGGTLDVGGQYLASASLTIAGGTVEVGGRVDVQSYLLTTGEATITGPGPFVVDRGATGTIGTKSCSDLTLDGASVTNEGALTAPAGVVSMEYGAEFDNPGAYIDESPGYFRCNIADVIAAGGRSARSSGAGGLSAGGLGSAGLITDSIGAGSATPDSLGTPDPEGYSFFNAGGIAPSIVSTGSFLSTIERRKPVVIGVDFNLDSGSLTVERGRLETTEALTATNSASVNVLSVLDTLGSFTVNDTPTVDVPGELDTQGPFTVDDTPSINVPGELEIQEGLAASGNPTISGGGEVLLATGASGTFGGGECSTHPVLSGVTLVNEGTLTIGAPGGAPDGALALTNGTQFQNDGTFNDDSYDPGCGYGSTGYSIDVASGGGAPSIVNNGTFQVDTPGVANDVGVNFGNDGHVEAQAGRLELSDGSLPERTGADGFPEPQATGSWSEQSGASIALTGGLFLFAGPVELGAVEEAGATVEQAPWSHETPGISGEAEEEQTLEGSLGVWTGKSAPTLSYVWQICGGEGPGEGPNEACNNVEDGAEPALPLTSEDVGATIRLVVTASNRLGSVTEASLATPSVVAKEGPEERSKAEEESAEGEEGEASMFAEPEGEEEASGDALVSRLPGPMRVQPDASSNSNSYTEDLCGSSKLPCGRYNGVAAAAYAKEWSLAGESNEQVQENRNTEYGYYGGEGGGDCTNFVSQALKAGGMRFMRAHGDNNTDATNLSKAPEEVFYKGQGSWWSYYLETPLGGTGFTTTSYTPTESFVRAGKLYGHLLEYGLARFVYDGQAVRPGDIVFYDLDGASMESRHIDHAQLVTEVKKGVVWVAQHSPAFVHTLGYVIHSVNSEPGKQLHTNWDFAILEPEHTAANIFAIE